MTNGRRIILQTKKPTNVGLWGNSNNVIYICQYVIYFLLYNSKILK
jgi:hypothetical protein